MYQLFFGDDQMTVARARAAKKSRRNYTDDTLWLVALCRRLACQSDFAGNKNID